MGVVKQASGAKSKSLLEGLEAFQQKFMPAKNFLL